MQTVEQVDAEPDQAGHDAQQPGTGHDEQNQQGQQEVDDTFADVGAHGPVPLCDVSSYASLIGAMLIDRQVTMNGAAEPTTMHVLDRASTATSFLVRPRWPYDKVFISDEALRRLMAAQNTLFDHGLTLALTRGYESRGKLTRIAHRLGRAVGMVLFCLVFPHRYRERQAIFSPNGHDRSGDCIDVALVHRGEMLTLLPLGVFTPCWLIRRARRVHQRELALAWSALASAGFSVHDNPTEAMQIHCELRG